MANELKVAISFDFSKGGAEAIRSESLSIDVAGDSMTHGVQGIPTGGEVLVESDELGTAGWVYAKNLDGTNFVTIGSHATDNHAIKLLAGEACVFRAAGSVYGKADTAACNVEYIIVEL
tara:strand:- start:39 stop:395 length:357 start_codon:yes stop_codon:yes gene_type:complete